MKIAVLLATGFEEGESLFVVDILRRAGFDAESVSTTGEFLVLGCQKLVAKADRLFGEDIRDYDMLVLPGGQPGANNLGADEKVLEMVRYFNENDKFIAAICAAPLVLYNAGISAGRTLTSYPTEKYRNMFMDCNYIEDQVVVVDGKLITSRGPATTLPFAYKLVEVLGGDAEALKEKMQYNFLCAHEVRK